VTRADILDAMNVHQCRNAMPDLSTPLSDEELAQLGEVLPQPENFEPMFSAIQISLDLPGPSAGGIEDGVQHIGGH
jgi:hypothetical protein